MSLQAQIEQDINQALKSGEQDKLSTLRLLKTAIKNQEIAQKADLSDAEVVKVIQKEAKQRRDSIDSYSQAGRSELADKEQAELAILEAYLPEQMSEEELTKLVEAAVTESGASSPADMGKVMQVLGPKIAGKADGGAVANLVRQKLSS